MGLWGVIRSGGLSRDLRALLGQWEEAQEAAPAVRSILTSSLERNRIVMMSLGGEHHSCIHIVLDSRAADDDPSQKTQHEVLDSVERIGRAVNSNRGVVFSRRNFDATADPASPARNFRVWDQLIATTLCCATQSNTKKKKTKKSYPSNRHG